MAAVHSCLKLPHESSGFCSNTKTHNNLFHFHLHHHQQQQLKHRFTKVSQLGFLFQKKKCLLERRRVKIIVTAQRSNSFSLDFGLNSKAIQHRDLSQLPWIGPLPGDIAEVEAYCRIFRAAEWLHNALMYALCNPLTGECSISYDVPNEDKPLLEDKIVSVLGCMVFLLNKGREDVLSGRSLAIKIFRESDLNIMENNTLPPLANFRGEMKSYCESLHVALENYLTPDDTRSSDLWRKLQKLKNVCYDSGFPRAYGDPCHTLFANWNPVYLSRSKEDMESNSEISFWSGGQVTEDGLQWLIEKGFKTIVDLREENVKDIFYERKLNEATLSGKIELIKLPVEVTTAPSMEQVEQFAALVSDSNKRSIYLHSKEGVWRTSAMVSRWKQYMSRQRSQHLSVDVFASLGIPSRDTEVLDEAQTTSVDDHGVLNGKNGKSLKKVDESGSSSRESLEQISQTKSKKSFINNGIRNTETQLPVTENGAEYLMGFNNKGNPLESQLPPPDIFSRKEMSKFLRSKRVSPFIYFNYERKRLELLSALKYDSNASKLRNESNQSHRLGSESFNGLSTISSASVSPVDDTSSGPNDSSSTFVNRKLHADKGKSDSVGNAEEQKSRSEVSTSKGNAEVELIGGDMCASATGVVRLQSRRKAEMFLVRTDGFSCTREKVTESSLAFTHPSTQQQMLMWKSPPKTALLLKKLGDELMKEAQEVASYLHYKEVMNVLVEPEVHDSFARIPEFGFVQTFYNQDISNLHERVDFVVCLGGDGVILHASNLFRGAVPPIVSFNLGSLGFLTSHSFEDYMTDLGRIIRGNNNLDGVYITLRMRLHCEIFRNGKAIPGKIFHVLNEVVVDRGSNPYLSKIECYEHDLLITKVQADGIIVATPTGSTAYSTSAGGSMVHPNVPCMLFTPICPHSLSFRPVILPDSAMLELKIPEEARSNAWISFDGKRRQQLSRGDSVRITMSQHPLPTVNKYDQTGDWFRSLVRCLNWNDRLDQLPIGIDKMAL